MPQTIWKGRLVFRLLSIPIKLHPAARRARVSFHNVYGIGSPTAAQADTAPGAAPSNVVQFPSNGPSAEPPIPDHVARVHQAYIGQEPNTLLAKDAILKAYEVGADNFAVFRPAELAALRAPKATHLPVTEFVDPDEIDPKYFDASYDIWPDHGGEKGYALFYLGLSERRAAAIGELALFGRERHVLIRPGQHGLVLHTLFYANEVNFEDEYHPRFDLVSEQERELTKTLMAAQEAKFEPSKLKDKYQERVIEFILNRCQSTLAATGSDKMPQPAPVLDIAEALRKSIELARMPPTSEPGSRPPKKGNGRRKQGS